MYFGGIEGLFSRGFLTFILVSIVLGAWKLIDIVIWFFSHLSISWS